MDMISENRFLALDRLTTRALPALLLSVMLVACGSTPERHPVPKAALDSAEIPGLPDVRHWGDEPILNLEEKIADVRVRIEANNPEAFEQPIVYLAISGGGAKGAFGAGLLSGWTEAGNRPEFTMVTGISTGALMAPFAFLGSEYDDELKALYTTISTKDVVEKRSLLDGLLGEALGGSDPLKELIARHIDEEVLSAIAKQYQDGRNLLIGTTNLDAGRPVIWNIGAIAASGHPDALELVRDVLRASAALPVAFPPVYIRVEADGQVYDEMHVDGGVASQVFLYPAGLDWRQVIEKVGLKGDSRVYVIRNSWLNPHWSPVDPNLASISGRSVDNLIRTQGIGDLYRIYLGAQRDGTDYNLAFIPASFEHEATEPFDPEFMRALFDLGYRQGLRGYPWEKAPPGFVPP
jgi:predicted patatin/cPLA2 family phospholipase